MAPIREETGRTLRLATRPDDPAPRMVRLSVVQRYGLWGEQFNVRESRAEPGAGQTLRLLGTGRFLCWRWLSRSDAERILRRRLGVLMGLGYRALDPAVGRGEWDWLQELTGRVAHGGAEHARALQDAVLSLGLPDNQLLRGLASVLDLELESLARPRPQTVAHVDLSRLTAVVSLLSDHHATELQAIAHRWLMLPTFLYEVDRTTLVAWLTVDGPLARAIAHRLTAEGLAILGPSTLRELSRTSDCQAVRDATGGWERHLA